MASSELPAAAVLFVQKFAGAATDETRKEMVKGAVDSSELTQILAGMNKWAATMNSARRYVADEILKRDAVITVNNILVFMSRYAPFKEYATLFVRWEVTQMNENALVEDIDNRLDFGGIVHYLTLENKERTGKLFLNQGARGAEGTFGFSVRLYGAPEINKDAPEFFAFAWLLGLGCVKDAAHYLCSMYPEKLAVLGTHAKKLWKIVTDDKDSEDEVGVFRVALRSIVETRAKELAVAEKQAEEAQKRAKRLRSE